MMSSAICDILVSPSVAIAIIFPDLALISWMLLRVLSYKSSWGQMAMVGVSSEIRAIGPCFNSPAG